MGAGGPKTNSSEFIRTLETGVEVSAGLEEIIHGSGGSYRQFISYLRHFSFFSWGPEGSRLQGWGAGAGGGCFWLLGAGAA